MLTTHSNTPARKKPLNLGLRGAVKGLLFSQKCFFSQKWEKAKYLQSNFNFFFFFSNRFRLTKIFELDCKDFNCTIKKMVISLSLYTHMYTSKNLLFFFVRKQDFECSRPPIP